MSKFLLLLSTLILATTAANADLQIKGDFRFRNEYIREDQAAPVADGERFRQRIRMRVGGTAKANENTDVILRLATGSALNTETTTTNQDLTDFYSKKSILLDLAYFNYKSSSKVQILGGKTPLYFNLAGGSDMIFDTDLTPEGLALKFISGEEDTEFFVNAGSSWITERYSATGSTDNTDVGLMAAQAGISFKNADSKTTVALADYNFSNIKGATAPSAKGNSVTAGNYINDYNLSALDLEYSFKCRELPMILFWEAAYNSAAKKYNKAGLVGLKIGKVKDVGSWSAAIDYREIEKDAVVGMLSDGDSSGGGADIRSIRLALAYQTAENANLGFAYFNGIKSISSTSFSPNYNRAMLDFNLNF